MLSKLNYEGSDKCKMVLGSLEVLMRWSLFVEGRLGQ